MSAWEVYLLLKLDSISALFETFAFIGGFITIIAMIIYFVIRSDNSIEDMASFKKVLSYFTIATFITILGFIAIPNTKQAALIWVVPKITSEQNVTIASDEAKELYGLAKEWLVEKVKDENPEHSKSQ